MAEAAHASGDGEDILLTQSRQETFGHFITATVWFTLHVVMAVALLTVAFALGAGWLAGVAVYAAIGVLAGLVLRLGGAYWALVIGSSILLALGGLVTFLFR
jgi:hypothetical protein